jgi:cytochrome c-type biogenesis protein
MLVYLAVFFAGIVSIISPCVLPVIPVIFAGSMGESKKGLLIVLGMILTFTLLGALFGTIGAIIPFREIGYMFLVGFALILASDRMYMRYTAFASKHTLIYRGASPLFLGAALGFIWSPCIGPIMGSVLSLAMIEGSALKGSLFMLVYGTGLAVSIAAILKASSKLRMSERIESFQKSFRMVAAAIILSYVFLEISGLMTLLQIAVSRYTFGIEERIAEWLNL